MSQTIRRVVTGHDAQGRSKVLIDGPAPNCIEYPQGTEGRFAKMWSTDALPASNAGALDAGDGLITLEPAARGSNFFVAHIPPGDTREVDTGMLPDDLEELRQGAAAIGAADVGGDTTRHPSMHRTKTLDYIIVLSGEVTLLLDEGEARLQAHDVVIQRGTNHTWINEGTETAIIAGVLLDAEPLPLDGA